MLIKEVFDQFLSEQKPKLAPKTYRDYESVIDLFENQLDGYAWIGEFLDYFVPRKVMSGDEFILKTCPRVIRKLLIDFHQSCLTDKPA
jgi:hypothetical protein